MTKRNSTLNIILGLVMISIRWWGWKVTALTGSISFWILIPVCGVFGVILLYKGIFSLLKKGPISDAQPIVNRGSRKELIQSIVLIGVGIIVFAFSFLIIPSFCELDDFICGVKYVALQIIILLPTSLVLMIWGIKILHNYFKN